MTSVHDAFDEMLAEVEAASRPQSIGVYYPYEHKHVMFNIDATGKKKHYLKRELNRILTTTGI